MSISETVCPECHSNEWGFFPVFGIFDCHKCEHEWSIEEQEKQKELQGEPS